MKANNIILRDAKKMKAEELRRALECAIGYDDWLNDKRSDKDKPVTYKGFEVHETKTGTIVVNKK